MSSRFLRALAAFGAALLIAAPLFWYALAHPSVFEAGFLHAGQDLLAGKAYGYLGAYPPGIPLFFSALLWFAPGLSAQGALVAQLLLFAVGASLWWICIETHLEERWLRIATWILSVANPYLVWTALTAKDTVFEWVFVVVFLGCLIPLTGKHPTRLEHRLWWSLGASAAFLAGLLMRVSMAPIALIALVLSMVASPRARQPILMGILIACSLTTFGFIRWQAKASGYTGLSSTLGLNIYYGQHPLYEAIHPTYDIDVFLDARVPESDVPPYSAKGSQALLALGREAIMNNPLAFVARSLRKSVWHWLSLEKLPHLTSATRLVDANNGTLTIQYQTPNQIAGMLYLVYKLLYLPVFLLGLVLWAAGSSKRTASIIFLAPMLALWPIAVLTFPDTRFKIVAEAVALLFIAIQIRESTPLLQAFYRSQKHQNDTR